MYFINKSYLSRIVINKSEFIGQVFPVNTLEDVEIILNKVRKEYYDATHNCYAYCIGDNHEIQKCSDDGEPQKTAGAPILEVIKKQGFTNVLVVVTRYFGGILLGAGGLARAYTEATASVLGIAVKLLKKQLLVSTFVVNYSEYNQLLKFPYLKVIDANFFTDVTVTIEIPLEKKEKLLIDLKNLLRVDDFNLTFSTIEKLTTL